MNPMVLPRLGYAVNPGMNPMVLPRLGYAVNPGMNPMVIIIKQLQI